MSIKKFQWHKSALIQTVVKKSWLMKIKTTACKNDQTVPLVQTQLIQTIVQLIIYRNSLTTGDTGVKLRQVFCVAYGETLLGLQRARVFIWGDCQNNPGSLEI